MEFRDQALAAREAAQVLAETPTGVKNAALHAMADALLESTDHLLASNAEDVRTAEVNGTSGSLIDRLRLTEDRIAGMAAGLRQLADLADPVGDVVRGWTTDNGLRIRQVRVPFGVIGIIYEARPNVTADAGGICLKSGNASLLRGSSSTIRSNVAVVEALHRGLRSTGLPEDAIQLVTGPRETTDEMMTARGLVDLLIPRGGAGLINHVVENSTIPVIETGTGNCHLYVDADADLDMAYEIMLNAKTQRPSVCNALETMLVHKDVAGGFLPRALWGLGEAGVTVHGDTRTAALSSAVVPAQESDFEEEWLSPDLSVRVVDSIDVAISHIRTFTSGHSETIVTDSRRASDRFVAAIDAAAVLVNASSRFVDGGEFGFGAEIGISTQKLHARGPMALPEMTSMKYVVEGTGQVRG